MVEIPQQTAREIIAAVGLDPGNYTEARQAEIASDIFQDADVTNAIARVENASVANHGGNIRLTAGDAVDHEKSLGVKLSRAPKAIASLSEPLKAALRNFVSPKGK